METVATVLGIAASAIGILTPIFIYERRRRNELKQLRKDAEELKQLRKDAEGLKQLRKDAEELKQLRVQYEDLIARNKRLATDFEDLRQGESGVLIRHEIDDLLYRLKAAIGAEGASVLVPEPSSRPPSFVYLCAQGPAAAKVEGQRLPLHKGVTGWVFEKGEARISGEASQDEHFFPAMDERTQYETDSLLTIPLWDAGRRGRVGVVQFVNKLNRSKFTLEDLDELSRRLRALSEQTERFTLSPENFRIFQEISERQSRQDAIMFCDLTASSQLFARVGRTTAIRCIKEYLESQTRVAFQHGAMVDKYLGDGIMLRFNVTSDDETYMARAVDAAQAMIKEFRELKQAWQEFDLDIESVHNRIGIASGPVFDESLGHPQFRQVTVIGEAVIRAQDLCDRAPRDRDVVLLDEETSGRIGEQLEVAEILFPDAVRPPSRAFVIDLPAASLRSGQVRR